MTEKEKYDKMHSIPGYSPGPGIAHVRTAQEWIKGDTVIDFGCGTGDAANAFSELGNKVYCVDISRIGLRHDLPFFECPLHELPKKLPRAPWGFCCDVMEHIPEEWVCSSLESMAKKVKACFFTISGVHDSWGKRIGQTLHMTVKPSAWWVKVIGQYWEKVTLLSDNGEYYTIIAQGPKC